MIPPPPTPRRPDHDHRPSMRMLVAASMLCHGHDPHQIAQDTGVPLALVELIGEQLDTHPATTPPPQATPPSRRDRVGHDTVGAGVDPPATATDIAQLLGARQRHARRRARIAVAALIGWVINLGLLATADIIHLPALGVTSLILTPVLVGGLMLNTATRRLSGFRSSRGASPR